MVLHLADSNDKKNNITVKLPSNHGKVAAEFMYETIST